MDKNEHTKDHTDDRRPWVPYLAAFAAGMVFVLLFLLAKGFFSGEMSSMDRLKTACDAFFIAGALTAGFGALIFVSGEGAFDGLIFAMRSLTWFFNILKPERKKETFAEYRQRVHEQKRSFAHLLVTGILLLIVAGILNGMYLARV